MFEVREERGERVVMFVPKTNTQVRLRNKLTATNLTQTDGWMKLSHTAPCKIIQAPWISSRFIVLQRGIQMYLIFIFC